MNYIYDIVLNFQDNYYEFFEWNRNDKIKNIRKIPLYRVTDQDILKLKYNKIKLDESFLKILASDKKTKKLMFLVSNTKISLGILLDEEGNLLKRSSLLFEEEEEVNSYSKTLTPTKLRYQEDKVKPPIHKLRIEREKKDNLINYIKNIQDTLTLKYLYYEYYKKEAPDIETIKKDLLTELEKPWKKEQNNIYRIVNLLNKKIYL